MLFIHNQRACVRACVRAFLPQTIPVLEEERMFNAVAKRLRCVISKSDFPLFVVKTFHYANEKIRPFVVIITFSCHTSRYSFSSHHSPFSPPLHCSLHLPPLPLLPPFSHLSLCIILFSHPLHCSLHPPPLPPTLPYPSLSSTSLSPPRLPSLLHSFSLSITPSLKSRHVQWLQLQPPLADSARISGNESA